MGDDMTKSATGFRDPNEGLSAHGRAVGDDDEDDEDMMFEGQI